MCVIWFLLLEYVTLLEYGISLHELEYGISLHELNSVYDSDQNETEPESNQILS